MQGTTIATTHRSGAATASALTLALLLLALPVAVLLAAVWLLGWHVAAVETGSMAPGMPTGSLMVSSPLSPDDVEVGMIIEFTSGRDGDRVITHRVVEVNRNTTGDLWFVTKGDANQAVDSDPVRPPQVRGQVRWHVAGLGGVLQAFRPPYSLAFVGLPLALLLLARGRRDQPDAPVLICGDCPAPVRPEDRYCRRCGARQVRRDPIVPSLNHPPSPARRRPIQHPGVPS